ncbi:MAG: hypothetical protein IH897_14340, partial [Planctomycetes bacterium]|nr:hypothetical protein [Planctomycetota bacterium]
MRNVKQPHRGAGCLMFLDSATRDECWIVKVHELPAWRTGAPAEEGAIPASRITADEWNFHVGKGADLFETLTEAPVKLGDVAARIAQGIRTSANEVYVLDMVSETGDLVEAYSKQLDRTVVLERRSLKSFVQGREIKPYRVLASKKLLLMPYRIRGRQASLISEDRMQRGYPRAWAYLCESRSYLQDREKGRFRGPTWYMYGRQQNIDLMLLPKILVPDIADRASFALDESGQYAFTSGYGITLKPEVAASPKYVLGLLNSKTLDFFLKKVSTTLRGGFFRYFTQYVQQLPIRRIDFSDAKDKAFHDREDPNALTQGYAQGRLMVEFMMSEWGDQIIDQLLQAY